MADSNVDPENVNSWLSMICQIKQVPLDGVGKQTDCHIEQEQHDVEEQVDTVHKKQSDDANEEQVDTWPVQQEPPHDVAEEQADTWAVQQEPPHDVDDEQVDTWAVKKEPPHDVKDGTSSGNTSRQVLVDFGLSRKKVFILDGSETLASQFRNHVSSDPAFAELLEHTFPVFQEFDSKFETWVDIDRDDHLGDGAVLKAMFFPKIIVTDERNSGSIKRKREEYDCKEMSKIWNIANKNESSLSSFVHCTEQNEYNNVSHLHNSIDNSIQTSPTYTLDAMRNENVISTHSNSNQMSQTTFKTADIALVTEQQGITELIPWSPSITSSPIRKNGSMSIHENNIKLHVATASVSTVDEKKQSELSDPKDVARCSTYTPRIFQLNFENHYAESTMAKRLYAAKEILDKRRLRNRHTIFSGVVSFSLKGNSIAFHKCPPSQTSYDIVTFCCFVFSNGEKIIAPVGSILKSNSIYNILDCEVTHIAQKYYAGSRLTFLYPGGFTQFESREISNFLRKTVMKRLAWPRCLKDVYPMTHAWEMVAKKLKHMHCFSKEEMVSLISRLWKEDLDIQLMHKRFVALMPYLIESVIRSKGSYPKIQVKWK